MSKYKISTLIVGIFFVMVTASAHADSKSTGAITVNVSVPVTAEIYPDPLPVTEFTFNPITTSNYTIPDPIIAYSEFSMYLNQSFGASDPHSLEVQLTTPVGQSDANNTWMNQEGGSGTIDYQVEYTTCTNGTVRAVIDLSSNSADQGIVCSNHTCTIPLEFANDLTCAPGFGGGGQLRIIRRGLPAMPDAGNYTGQFTLTATAV